MSHKLINHSPDLKRLWDEGYEIEISEGFLLLRHVPYLNSAKEVCYGVLVSALDLAGDITQSPQTHALFFAGDAPCDKDGKTLDAIINSSREQQLTPKIKVNHYLSSKPPEGYADYFEKMTTYASIISASAKSLDDSVTEKTFNVVAFDDAESVFNYFDTNSSRAKINLISGKLTNQKIAIIGVGGTGGYILDSVAKTPVAEIHLFDGDYFKSNNAFRAPGAPAIEELRERPKKTDYFKKIYSNMHRGIFSHSYFIDSSNFEELADMDFVFLSLDDGNAKKQIVEYLRNKSIPFVDSGMGLQNVDDSLIGTLRVTTSTERKNDHLERRIPFIQEIENEYVNNIQIAELNSLCANLAIIKWKKLFSFYHDLDKEHNTSYTVELNLLTGDDYDA